MNFDKLAQAIALSAGRPITFIVAVVLVVVWSVSGSIFGFSDTWQLVINTGTTIVTLLVVFLIQNTQEPRHRRLAGQDRRIADPGVRRGAVVPDLRQGATDPVAAL